MRTSGRNLTLILLLLAVLGLAPAATRAAGDLEALIGLLSTKGVLTAEEAASLEGGSVADLVSLLAAKGILSESEQATLAAAAPSAPAVTTPAPAVTTPAPAAPAPAASKSAPVVKHGRSFSLVSADQRFSLDIYGYGQVRYTFTDKDDGGDASNFSVQRTRLGFKGKAFSEKLNYRVYFNVYSGNEKGTDLFDFFADYVSSSKFGLKLGQWKVPYAEGWNTSASKLQFVERTQVDKNFRFDRDTGVAIHGKLFDKKLGYDVGVFNGEGRNRNNNGNSHLYVARARFEPLGSYPTQEGDTGYSKDPKLRITLAGGIDNRVSEHTRSNLNGRLAALGESDVTQYSAFAGWLYHGASFHGEYHHREIDPLSGAATETAEGYYLQSGYFIRPKTLEIAARYENFDPDTGSPGDSRRELGLGLNYLFDGPLNKVQIDVFQIQVGDTDDLRLRVQYQVGF